MISATLIEYNKPDCDGNVFMPGCFKNQKKLNLNLPGWAMNDMKKPVKQELKNAINAVSEAINKQKSTEQTTSEILITLRQYEPEEQNSIVATVLKEIAIDRQNSVRQYSEARDRAGKNHDEFMINAIGLEKILAEEIGRKR